LSRAHHVVADGFQLDDNVPPINLDNLIIQKSIVFKTMDALKICLVEYVVFHHCPFIINNLAESKCYIVICRHVLMFRMQLRKRTELPL
jgi:hypothetical protein